MQGEASKRNQDATENEPPSPPDMATAPGALGAVVVQSSVLSGGGGPRSAKARRIVSGSDDSAIITSRQSTQPRMA